ncbi:hypothetical protein [Ruegeria atlantica]|uniref:hypothetical protein n=1 Tax=Ruegeria atlantica TaxID=81569 RepID=UPI00147BA2B0|nr:hypothetical protein [Ruegeria atlantica]
MDTLNTTALPPADAKALLNEALRVELSRILAEQNSMGSLSNEDVNERIEKLEAENKKLRRAARRGNWEGVQELLKKASEMKSLALPNPLSPDLGRQAISLKWRINDIENDVADGDDVRTASRALLKEHGIKNSTASFRSPFFSHTLGARPRKNHPTPSIQGNINALEKLTLEFFGDIPVSAITRNGKKSSLLGKPDYPAPKVVVTVRTALTKKER